MKTVGIVGYGNMGSSIVDGMRRVAPHTRFVAIEKSDKRRAEARAADVDVIETFGEFFGEAEIVVLAIKPQDIDAFARKAAEFSADARIVSILAGTSIDTVSTALGTATVCRMMPSLAAEIGAAVVGVAFRDGADDVFRDDALAVARAIGTAFELPEKLISAVTGISGSGIAFVFAFLHALALGGTRAGLDYPTALSMAEIVADGAVALLRKHDRSPSDFITRVASPAGTTIDGLRELEHGRFTATVMDAVVASARRAEQLES